MVVKVNLRSAIGRFGLSSEVGRFGLRFTLPDPPAGSWRCARAAPTRWKTTLSLKSFRLHVIDFGALRGADVVPYLLKVGATKPSECRRERTVRQGWQEMAGRQFVLRNHTVHFEGFVASNCKDT